MLYISSDECNEMNEQPACYAMVYPILVHAFSHFAASLVVPYATYITLASLFTILGLTRRLRN